MTTNNTAIHIENLTRDFGKVRALDGLALEVPAGIIFGFLGPNGAGKTTTLNLLLGLLSGIFLAIHFATWISSLEYTSVASSVVLVSTGPLWVALLSDRKSVV